MQSIERHIQGREIELGSRLTGKLSIYLDTKYWLIFRDVILGRRAGLEKELLEVVQCLVSRGDAFCPLSDGTLAELLKQADASTRNATADLVDELSGGISIAPLERRIAREAAYLIGEKCGFRGIPDLQQLMWTKVSNVLGYFAPRIHLPSDEDQFRVEKEFFDLMWDKPLGEIIRGLGEGDHGLGVLDETADRINKENARHALEMKSFQNVYEAEARGFLDTYISLILKSFESHFRSKAGTSVSEDIAVEVRKICTDDLVSRRADSLQRTAYIFAMLHAAVRWNRIHRIVGNTLLDFRHASAAIPYCDVFLTERQLAALSTAKHVALDRDLQCKVIASPDAAITILSSYR